MLDPSVALDAVIHSAPNFLHLYMKPSVPYTLILTPPMVPRPSPHAPLNLSLVHSRILGSPRAPLCTFSLLRF